MLFNHYMNVLFRPVYSADDELESLPDTLPILQTLDVLPLLIDLAVEPVPVGPQSMKPLHWPWFN
jgi:hypothetical protein